MAAAKIASRIAVHHPVTALLTRDEYSEFATIAKRSDMKPAAFLTKIAKLYIQQEKVLRGLDSH